MARKVLVGMLILGALFIFGLATFYVENWQFYLGKGYRLRAKFPIAQTLDKGDLVRLAGVQVGTVEDLDVNTTVDTPYPVEAVLWIRSEVQVRAEDTAVIKMSTLFGGNYVSIRRGDPKAPVLSSGELINNTDVAPSVTEVIEQSTVTMKKVSEAVDEVSAAARQMTEGKGTIGRLLTDEEFFNKLDAAVTDAGEAATGLKKASRRLEEGEGVLGKLLMDDQMAEDLQTLAEDTKVLAANLREVSEDLAAGRGTMGRLMKDETLYENLTESTRSLKETTEAFAEGEGILPQLVNDAELANELRALTDDLGRTAANLREISEKMKSGEGTLGKLLASDEAYRKLEKSLQDLNEATTALSEGRGTLGKLMNDDKLYRQISQIADDLQATLETYREQSPVLTFTGALFGAF